MTVCEQLKCLMEEHFARHPNVSINALAMKSGVGATTLRRILGLTIKGEPAPHTILNLVSALSNERRLAKLVTSHDGPIGQVLREAFGQFAEEDYPHSMAPDLNEALSDPICYVIYKLCANRAGGTRLQIVDLYGRVGLEKMAELLQMGLLEEREGVVHARDKNFSLDLSVAARHLPELVKLYRPHEVQRGMNVFYSLSESLNQDGINKVKSIQREAAKKIYEVMNCPYYEGELPYFTVNLGETMNAAAAGGPIQ